MRGAGATCHPRNVILSRNQESETTDLTEIQPAEYRADLVVVLLDGDLPVKVVIVEVQLAADPRKRLSWPAYVTVARASHGCLADLLVVAPDPAVAGWCAQAIEIGVSGFVLRPPVLRRSAVPIVTDPGEAARRPELGVLSAMAHGENEQGATIAAAVLPAIRGSTTTGSGCTTISYTILSMRRLAGHWRR